jgi:hypothetical protein
LAIGALAALGCFAAACSRSRGWWIVARARDLASGQKVFVVLLDYRSVWLGGQYAADQGGRSPQRKRT